MISNKGNLLGIKETASSNGLGTLVAVYNDIENKWYYYVGNFKPRKPSNNIEFSSISGKCINYILENQHVYFSGDMAKNELIATKIQDLPSEEIEFPFRFIWFK